MSRFFKPYEGTKPFLFISYAHRESNQVVDTIRILHEKGYRLWYDEGIPAGSDWPANIARHMQNCERVVFFVSARALESQNCYSEIRTASRLKKPILLVRLEDTVADERWAGLLEEKTEIPIRETATERAEAILNSGFVPRRFYHSAMEEFPWRALGLAASLLMFLGAAGVLGALAGGYWNPFPAPTPPQGIVETPSPTPAPTPPPVIELGAAERFFAVQFPDSQQERAVRRALDDAQEEIYRWQLADIRELYFCGNMITKGLESIRFDPDGTCRVNGAPVIMGQVSDLSLLENAVRLEKLALICQPLKDLSSLNGHLLLWELSLAGSSVTGLSGLEELPSLTTIHLEHTQVNDLRPLEALKTLKTVTVSQDMLPLRWNKSAGFRVVLVK